MSLLRRQFLWPLAATPAIARTPSEATGSAPSAMARVTRSRHAGIDRVDGRQQRARERSLAASGWLVEAA